MSGIGFSVTDGVGVELSRIYGMFDYQIKFAEQSLASSQKTARIEAVAQILSAYITVSKQPPTEAILKKWAAEIHNVINQIA